MHIAPAVLGATALAIAGTPGVAAPKLAEPASGRRLRERTASDVAHCARKRGALSMRTTETIATVPAGPNRPSLVLPPAIA